MIIISPITPSVSERVSKSIRFSDQNEEHEKTNPSSNTHTPGQVDDIVKMNSIKKDLEDNNVPKVD